jgi:hypothetical protein
LSAIAGWAMQKAAAITPRQGSRVRFRGRSAPAETLGRMTDVRSFTGLCSGVAAIFTKKPQFLSILEVNGSTPAIRILPAYRLIGWTTEAGSPAGTSQSSQNFNELMSSTCVVRRAR